MSVAENAVYEMERFTRAAALAERNVQEGITDRCKLTDLASNGASYASVSVAR